MSPLVGTWALLAAEPRSGPLWVRYRGIRYGLGGRVYLPVCKLPTLTHPGGCPGSRELGLTQVEKGFTSLPPAPGTVLQQFDQEAGQVVGAEHAAQGTQRKAKDRGGDR